MTSAEFPEDRERKVKTLFLPLAWGGIAEDRRPRTRGQEFRPESH